MKSLITITLLLLSFSAQADQDCKALANQAYNEMLEYQITGKTDNKEIKESTIVINFFDKKYEATQYAFKAFDKCDK